MDNNQKPVVDENIKLNKNVEDNGENYTFVQERIVSKRHRLSKLLLKLLTNIIVPVAVCVVVIQLYIGSQKELNNPNPDEQNQTTTYNGIQIDDSVEDESTNQGETPNEGEEGLVKLEELIKNMTVVVSVVRREEVIIEEEGTSNEETTSDEEATSDEEETTDEEESSGEDAPEIKTEIVVTTTKYTGAIISSNGPVYILIPSANIEGYDEIYSQIANTTMISTTVYNVDEATGLAVLKVEASRITPAMRESIKVVTFEGDGELSEGEEVVYCGSVVGNSPLFFKGHISNSSNVVNCVDINFDLLITDIMYEDVVDGFIFNDKGNIIGIAGMDYGELALPDVVAGAKAIDLSYVINNMLNDRNSIYVGIVGQDVSPEIEELAGERMPDGIYVKSVVIDSPAYNAGLMAGDIIISIGGDEDVSIDDFRTIIEKMSKGDTVQIRVKRKIGTVYNTYTLTVFLETTE